MHRTLLTAVTGSTYDIKSANSSLKTVETHLITATAVVLITWSSTNARRSRASGLAPSAAVTVVLSPQSRKPLLLGVRVDVCTNDESNNVEERYPSVLWKEFLGERQRNGRHDPANLHDRHEAGLDGGTNLVEGTCTGDDSHGDKIDSILDGGYL